MSNKIEFISYQDTKDKWEEINKTKEIYLAYDCELMPMLITDNIWTIQNFCYDNNVSYSIYPIGTYTRIN